MSDPTPRIDWAVSGLAHLLDTVIIAASRSSGLTDADREHFAESGAAAFVSGMSLSQLVGTFLGGAGEIWEHAFSDVEESQMVELGRSLRRVSEQAVGSLAEGFESAQRLSIRAEESLRRSFLDDLLTLDADVGRLTGAAQDLDVPTFDQAVVAVARSSRGITDAGPVHRHIRSELEARAPERELWVTAKDGNLVVIALDTTPHDLGGLVSQAVRLLEDTPWRIGVGSTADALEAVAGAYRDATEAVRIGVTFQLPSPTEFGRILAQRLLSADERVTDALIRSVVDPLMAKPSGELWATLISYIEHGGNMARVARDLDIGARTVAYRLERIGEITGFDPGVSEDRFVLEAACRARPLLARRQRRSE